MPFLCRLTSVDQHHIEETRLVTRRSARDQIHLAWNYQCAYCGDHLGRSPTLDHVVPRAKGGGQHRANTISCCLMCNSQKGHRDWQDWFRRQEFWTLSREQAIQSWIDGDS
jgi:5-methylcytosine-specific restriction endonuclease McrA